MRHNITLRIIACNRRNHRSRFAAASPSATFRACMFSLLRVCQHHLLPSAPWALAWHARIHVLRSAATPGSFATAQAPPARKNEERFFKELQHEETQFLPATSTSQQKQPKAAATTSKRSWFYITTSSVTLYDECSYMSRVKEKTISKKFPERSHLAFCNE